MTGSDKPSITCPACGSTSHNPNDVVNRYCGRCHQFHDTLSPVLLSMDGVTAERVMADVTTGGRVLASETSLRLKRLIALVVDIAYAVTALGFFIAGKFDASWWWLLFLVPYGLIMFRQRRTFFGGIRRMQELQERGP